MAKTFFKNQQNGYDKKQVDNYIKKLIKAYQAAYKEYLDLAEKYVLPKNLYKKFGL